MNENFSFFLPLVKVDKEKRLVSGYASTQALDLDGEIISKDAVQKALPGYWEYRNIREMHQPSAVGIGKEANIDSKGLFLTAKIVDDAAWKKVDEGVYKGFSIGGRKLAKTGNIVTAIEMVEISIVDRPANPECKFEIAKRAKGSDGAYLMKVQKRRSPTEKAVGQMAKVVRTLSKANPPAANDGFSLPTAKIADTSVETPCKHGNDPASCTKCAAKAAKKVTKAAKLKDDRDQINNQALALGVTLPDNWSRKLAKRLIAAAETTAKAVKTASALPALDLTKSAGSSFLTLKADSGVILTAEGEIKSSHELDLGGTIALGASQGGDLGKTRFSKRERKLLKRMGVAGSLSYCFDSIRSAQRELLYEAKREGGDMKDKGLAAKLGQVAQTLAGVIGQKAEHEGAEALDLSDADDQGMLTIIGEEISLMAKEANTSVGANALTVLLENLAKRGAVPTRAQHFQVAKENMKKARAARKEASAAIKDAHAMHKAAYLAKMAKAAKKPADKDADEEFDHQGAMEKLQKAYGALERSATFSKAAKMHLAKAAAGRTGQKGQQPTDGEAGIYEVPDGLTELSNSEIATAGPGGRERGSMPFELMTDKKITGKAAGVITVAHAEVLARLAAAEARADVLEKMPAGPIHGRRPVNYTPGFTAGTDDSGSELLKGVDKRVIAGLGSDDEEIRKSAVGGVIGSMILGGKGKSVFDNAFHGTAGAGRA